MGFVSYLKHSLWDFILCAVASIGLCWSCLIAFKATSPFLSNLAPVIIACTLLCAALFFVAYRFITAVVGSVCLAIAFCAAIVVCWRFSGAESLFDDAANNYVYLTILITLCTVAVFALSRKRVTTVILLVGGLLVCALMEYLYFIGLIAPVIMFGIATAALYALKNYQKGLAGSQTEKISFGSTSIAGIVLAAIATLLACCLFIFVIAPLSPPHITVKLVSEHVRVQEEHVKGVGDKVSVVNPDLFSMNVVGGEENAQGNEGVLQQSQNMDNTKRTESNVIVLNAGSAMDLDDNGENEEHAITLKVPNWLPLVLAALVILAIAAVITVRKLLRRKRLNAIKALAAAESIRSFYLLFLKRFSKMGIDPPATQTLAEYSIIVEPKVRQFERVSTFEEISEFSTLTDIYTEVVYGNATPSDENIAAFDRYANMFYKRALKFVGVIKYIPLFFRI